MPSFFIEFGPKIKQNNQPGLQSIARIVACAGRLIIVHIVFRSSTQNVVLVQGRRIREKRGPADDGQAQISGQRFRRKSQNLHLDAKRLHHFPCCRIRRKRFMDDDDDGVDDVDNHTVLENNTDNISSSVDGPAVPKTTPEEVCDELDRSLHAKPTDKSSLGISPRRSLFPNADSRAAISAGQALLNMPPVTQAQASSAQASSRSPSQSEAGRTAKRVRQMAGIRSD